MPLLIRIVRSDPPILADFWSQGQKGIVPIRPLTGSDLQRWWAVSMFESLEIANARRRKQPSLGSYLATVDMDIAGARLERSYGRGHYTVYADPAALLAAVVRVVPCS